MNALIISDFDSRISWCNGFASRLKTQGFITTFIALHKSDDLSKREISKNIDKFIYIDNFWELKDLFSEKYSLIIIMVGGGMYLKIYEVFKSAYSTSDVRPILISGFNGIEDTADPDGLLMRTVSDFICINSLPFLEFAQDLLSSLPVTTQLVRTGFIRDYWNQSFSSTQDSQEKVNSLMFVLQPGIIDQLKHLKYLGQWIEDYHNQYPNRKIIIKARGRENIPHVNSAVESDYYMAFWHDLVSRLGNNIELSYEETERILPKVDVVISITSAILLEAVILNKKVAALADFGTAKRIGNHYLIDSKMMIPKESILSDDFPQVDIAWKRNWCLFDESLLDNLISKAYKVYRNQYQHGKLSFIEPYYNEISQPYLFLFKNQEYVEKKEEKTAFYKLKGKIKSFYKKIL